jgi:hypothetical protein
MGFETVIQKVVYQALLQNQSLLALITGVFDAVEQGTAYPYVTIGEDVHNEWDTDTTLGSDATITIHTWSQAKGRKEVKQIQGEIYNALHRADLCHDGYKIVTVEWQGSQSFLDADGETRHGVQTFRVVIDKA